MGLESATYISGLNANNPINATDVVGEGDDHLRLIKSTLLNTFPNITGAMSLTQAQLNNAAIKTESNTFTGTVQTFSTATSVSMRYHDSAAAADEKYFRLRVDGGVYDILAENDALSSSTLAYRIARSGIDVTTQEFRASNYFGLLGGGGLRIYDSASNYGEFTHNGSSLILTYGGAALTNLILDDGIDLRVYDAGSTDYISLIETGSQAQLYSNNNAIYFYPVFTTLGQELCLMDANRFEVRGGKSLRCRDAANTDYIDLAHDGIDAIFSFNATTSVKFQDGIGLRVYDATDADYIELSHTGTYALISTAGTSQIRVDNNLVFRGGQFLQINDSSNADNIAISHDGTDVDVAFVGTTAIKFRDGIALRIYDSTDAKFIGLKHDGTDAVWVSSGVTEFDWTSLSVKSDNDTADEIGWKGTPQNSKSDNYTLLLSDAGKQIYLSAGASKTLTIPANSVTAFPIGTIIVVVNDSGNNWSIAITTDTLEKYGGSTGTQTLGDNNKAVLEKVTSTLWKYASTD